MNCTSGLGATIPRGPSWTGTTTYPAQANRLPEDACLAVLFLVSDAEHYRCIVGAPQEYIEARPGRLPREQRKAGVSPICSQLIKQERIKRRRGQGMPKYVI